MNQTNDAKKDDKKKKDVTPCDDKQKGEAQDNKVRKDDAPQLGHFLDYHRHWLQGLALLKYQLNQLKETKKQKPNRHFNTLDMCYYAKLRPSFATLANEDYFCTRIANNRFYGLRKEFEVVPYTIPKTHLGLRQYKFMTCPMRVLYYAIGVYTPNRLILRLSSGQQSLIMWINCVCGFNIAFLVFDEEIL